MISQHRLIEHLSSCGFIPKKLHLPTSRQYTQRNYYEVKKLELDTVISQVNALNKVTNAGPIVDAFGPDLDAKYKELMSTADTNTTGGIHKEGTKDLVKAKRIDYESYLSYNENEIISAPSQVTNFLKEGAQGFNVLLYGNKNPESFYKALLILKMPEFMIKNKYERNAEVLRIKKEMAFAVKKLYHDGKYNLLCNGKSARVGFNKDKMIHNLLNKENYVDPTICQVAADFFKRNLIIYDLAKKSYELYIAGPFDAIFSGTIDPVTHFRNVSWLVMVQYQGAYLPVFCIDIHHLFPGSSIISQLMSNNEWSNPDFYRPLPEKAKPVELVKPIVQPAVIIPEPAVIQPAIIEPAVIQPVSVTQQVVGLKPVGTYLLAELQQMAEVAGINTKKPAKSGGLTNKTKQELYDALDTNPAMP